MTVISSIMSTLSVTWSEEVEVKGLHLYKNIDIFMPASIVELRLLYSCNQMPSKYKRRYTSGGKQCNKHFKHHFQLIPTFTQPSQSTTDTFLTGCSTADEHQKTGRRGEKWKQDLTAVRGHSQHLHWFRLGRLISCCHLQSNQKWMITHLYTTQLHVTEL